MRHFTQLFTDLDSTTSTNARVEGLVRYFETAPDPDKVWLIALFTGRRPSRIVNYRLLGQWAAEMAALPEWLFAESYHVVGDYAETIALFLPEPGVSAKDAHTLSYYMHLLRDLKDQDETGKKTAIMQTWAALNQQERFIFNKLMTGGLRIGISQKLMIRALAQYLDDDETLLTARLMGDWDPATIPFKVLVQGGGREDALSKPYPFHLAHALDVSPSELGAPGEWLVERKWDGIRGQIIVRGNTLYIWSRGEELVTEKYPELHPLSSILPAGTVLDVEILAFRDGKPLSFQAMQRRIGRKTLSKKLLGEVPVRAMAYDLIEWQGKDIRTLPLNERRKILESLFTDFLLDDLLILSAEVHADSWDVYNRERLSARTHRCEGLMLKQRDGIYEVGRRRGNWWKWKTDPYNIDCVMIYAQRGHGRRAGMFTDYTFAVWDEDLLVPFAKAYSGLTDAEFEEITQWVGQNTIERFGPVCVVPPVHVFELHFEGIGYSPRHKSGIAVRFPRIHRWRKDKSVRDADTLDNLKRMIDH